MPIYFTLIIKSKKGFADELKTELKALIKPTLSEASCLQVTLFQDEKDINLFLFYEIWFDEYGFERHKEKPYIRNFLERSKHFLDGSIKFHRMFRVADN